MKLIQFPGGKVVNNGRSKGAGVIVIRLTEEGKVSYRYRGSLSHLEKVGMLTMCLHGMEYRAMTGGEE